MSRLLNWLAREATGSYVLILITVFVLANLVYADLMIWLIAYWQVSISNIVIGIGCDETLMTVDWRFPTLLFKLAFKEEVLYRLPLVVLRKSKPPTAVLIVALIISILFGVAHGSLYNILIQGVGGFSFCLLFLKCGGLQGNYAKAILVTTIAHACYNVVVILGSFSLH